MGTEAEEKVDATTTDDVSTPEDQAKGSDDQTKQPAEDKGKDEGYDKQKQQLDQERANNRRLRQALEAATGERDELQGQMTDLKTEMTDLKGQIKQHVTTKEYQDLASLDPDTTDVPDLVKALQANLGKTQKLEETLTAQQKVIDAFQQRDRQTQEVQAHSATVERIYKHCDKKFGAKYRNAAIARADELVTNGEIEKPDDVLGGVELMERCYEEVKAEDKPKETKTKKTVPTDTGLRGLSLSQLDDTDDEIGTGTIEEVKAKMLKQARAGKLNLSTFASSQ